MEKQVFQEAEYHFRPLENLFRFEEVAVVTSEQQCNDLARMLIVENFSVSVLAYAMQLCLFFTAPQRGGFGGSSTAVFVDAQAPNEDSSCHVIDPFEDYKISYIHDDPNKQFVGKCVYEKLYGTPFNSVALPGEIITMMRFVNDSDGEELAKLSHLLKVHNYTTYAISKSIAECNRIESPRLVISEELNWMFDPSDSFRPLDEGERYTIEIGEMGDGIAAGKSGFSDGSFIADTLPPLCIDNLTAKIVEYAEHMYKIEKATGWRINGGRKFGNYRLCMPAPYREALAKADEETTHNEGDGEVTGRILTITEILTKLCANVKKMKGSMKQHPSFKNYSNSGRLELNAEERKNEGPWQANMFVIISRKEKKAIAYSGTLGRFFGSKIQSGSFYFLNNILAEVKDENNKTDPFVRLLPAILYTKNEISLALATHGGSTRHSLSLPRTIYMLVLKQKFNVSISESAGYPLAFPSTENFDLNNIIVMKDRVPYVERLHRLYVVKDTKLNLPDELVAIESVDGSLLAAHANHLGEDYNLPAGF
ncbi:hypothetical protein Y032_0220g2522 [Ancylostoma ceylanicum]|uniref:Uncharacterized protein n=1 Tax=Ancylostoma ceylanicum TaxID=53326 RepID=A0A016SJD7_9BILA|nr:hypothetical protein Y032_0220g2522 [Ancylostoma ceylanicum]